MPTNKFKQENEDLKKEAESLRSELKRIKIYMSMAAAILGKVKEEE